MIFTMTSVEFILTSLLLLITAIGCSCTGNFEWMPFPSDITLCVGNTLHYKRAFQTNQTIVSFSMLKQPGNLTIVSYLKELNTCFSDPEYKDRGNCSLSKTLVTITISEMKKSDSGKFTLAMIGGYTYYGNATNIHVTECSKKDNKTTHTGKIIGSIIGGIIVVVLLASIVACVLRIRKSQSSYEVSDNGLTFSRDSSDSVTYARSIVNHSRSSLL